MGSMVRQHVGIGSTVNDLETHRNAITTADTGDPSASAFWDNPGWERIVMVYAYVSFVGGSSPTVTITPWLKNPKAATPIGVQDPYEYGDSSDLAAGKYVFVQEVHGADFFAYIDNVAGSPTSFAVTVYVQPA